MKEKMALSRMQLPDSALGASSDRSDIAVGFLSVARVSVSPFHLSSFIIHRRRPAKKPCLCHGRGLTISGRRVILAEP